jgi:hypothetical protein
VDGEGQLIVVRVRVIREGAVEGAVGEGEVGVLNVAEQRKTEFEMNFDPNKLEIIFARIHSLMML